MQLEHIPLQRDTEVTQLQPPRDQGESSRSDPPKVYFFKWLLDYF